MSWLDILNRLRTAKPGHETNEVFQEIQQGIKNSMLKTFACKLKDQSSISPDRVIDSAADILQNALLKLFLARDRFRGSSDAEAEAFVRQVLNHVFLDIVKTPARREAIWRRWLRGWNRMDDRTKAW